MVFACFSFFFFALKVVWIILVFCRESRELVVVSECAFCFECDLLSLLFPLSSSSPFTTKWPFLEHGVRIFYGRLLEPFRR